QLAQTATVRTYFFRVIGERRNSHEAYDGHVRQALSGVQNLFQFGRLDVQARFGWVAGVDFDGNGNCGFSGTFHNSVDTLGQTRRIDRMYCREEVDGLAHLVRLQLSDEGKFRTLQMLELLMLRRKLLHPILSEAA